jgi:hypothetical protein
LRPHVEFSKTQVSPNVGERREGTLPSNELRHELKSVIEAAHNVQHQGAVGDGLAKVGESVSHTLHLTAVIIDGESALR